MAYSGDAGAAGTLIQAVLTTTGSVMAEACARLVCSARAGERWLARFAAGWPVACAGGDTVRARGGVRERPFT